MWGRTYIEDLEREFKTDKMRDKRVFHDLNIRVQDPEELRRHSIEILSDNGYHVSLNEMTEFEDNTEFEGLFRGGRLKPLKTIIKGVKTNPLGPRYPLIWKVMIIIGIISVIGVFLPYPELNHDLLFWVSIIAIFTGFFVYLIKENAALTLWIKMVGIYDAEGIKADVRLIISADADKERKDMLSRLKEDVSYIYDDLARRYIKDVKPEERIV